MCCNSGVISGIFWVHRHNLSKYNWAVMWENVPSDMCAKLRLRSTCASAQSDQSLRYPHVETFRIIGYPKCLQWRFWSDYAHAQADLNLRWAHICKGTFSDVAAQRSQLCKIKSRLGYESHLSQQPASAMWGEGKRAEQSFSIFTTCKPGLKI